MENNLKLSEVEYLGNCFHTQSLNLSLDDKPNFTNPSNEDKLHGRL